MNIYVGLLFNQGHLHDPDLVRALAADADARDAAAAAGPPPGPPADDPPERCIRRRRGWVALCTSTALSLFR